MGGRVPARRIVGNCPLPILEVGQLDNSHGQLTSYYGGNLVHSCKSNQSLCECMPGKRESIQKMRSCSSERSAFFGEEFMFVE